MEDILCYEVDTESEKGKPIAEQFGVTGLPALIVLNADGSVRDRWLGYLKPDDFIQEIQRIVDNDGTIDAMKRAIEADPNDLEQRYRLLQKYQMLSDIMGYAEQVREIQTRDPEGKHVVSHRLRLDQIIDEMRTSNAQSPDMTKLLAFLDKEEDGEILFQGHELASRLCLWMAQNGEAERVPEHHKQMMASYRVAWTHCPEESLAAFGASIARNVWVLRESLDAEARAFALEVARKAASLEPENAHVIDSLACSLFMNGLVDEAIEQAERGVELAPDDAELARHLETFRAQTAETVPDE